MRALDDVSLTLHPGRIHALVGENGAGKSTVVRILAGLLTPTAGELSIDGAPARLASRAAAIARGIGLVPQQLSLLPEFTLAENVAVSAHSKLVHRSDATRALEVAAADAEIQIRPDVPVHEMGLAERQLGELVIALAQGARILLLDEPTSALGPLETAGLFARVRALAESGVTVVLITHRLAEVREVADEVTVLNRGRVTMHARVADVTDAELVFAMVGDVPAPGAPRAVPAGAARLRLDGVTAGGDEGIHEVSLEVAGGEILGIVGVAGNGQRALAETIIGALPRRSGSIHVDGRELAAGPRAAAQAGIGYVPEDRREALLPRSPLTHSVALGHLDTPGVRVRGRIRWSEILRYTRDLIAAHDVRPADPRVNAGALSGGNAQKLLVGRELELTGSVLVLHGPTQGLDLAAAGAIRRRVREAAETGIAVVLISADLDEVRELADRTLVLTRGEIVAETTRAGFDLAVIGRAMAGLAETA